MPRDFLPGQRAQLYIYDCVAGTSTLVLETSRVLIEAPNWTPDAKHLIVNGAGRLFALEVARIGGTDCGGFCSRPAALSTPPSPPVRLASSALPDTSRTHPRYDPAYPREL